MFGGVTTCSFKRWYWYTMYEIMKIWLGDCKPLVPELAPQILVVGDGCGRAHAWDVNSSL
jgi:hypothetical protein